MQFQTGLAIRGEARTFGLADLADSQSWCSRAGLSHIAELHKGDSMKTRGTSASRELRLRTQDEMLTVMRSTSTVGICCGFLLAACSPGSPQVHSKRHTICLSVGCFFIATLLPAVRTSPPQESSGNLTIP